MVNQEIFEGIKNAVSRGQSLRDAMMSFFNAGYNREEIMEAARAVQLGQTSIPNPVIINQQPVSPINLQPKPLIPLQQIPTTQNPQTLQKVSNYETPKRSWGNKILLAGLSLLFFMLFVGLILAFIFKTRIVQFFTDSMIASGS